MVPALEQRAIYIPLRNSFYSAKTAAIAVDVRSLRKSFHYRRLHPSNIARFSEQCCIYDGRKIFSAISLETWTIRTGSSEKFIHFLIVNRYNKTPINIKCVHAYHQSSAYREDLSILYISQNLSSSNN